MFYLFFTAPADSARPGDQHRRPSLTTRHKVTTWSLVLLWLILIVFGAVSFTNPSWLQKWARKGVQAESLAYKQYGDAFLQRGNYRRAVAQYQRSLQIKPEQVGVMINMAVAYMYGGAYDQAGEILTRASQIESNLGDLIEFNFGELMERQGKKEEAAGYYEKTLGSNFIDPDLVNRKLGLLYLDAGQYEKALKAFENVLASQTDINLPYMDMLLRGLDSYQNDTVNLSIIENHLARGISVEDMAPYDLNIIRLLQQSDREIAKTYNHLAYIYIQMNDYDAAARSYEKSLEIWPGNSDARQGLLLISRMKPDLPSSGSGD